MSVEVNATQVLLLDAGTLLKAGAKDVYLLWGKFSNNIQQYIYIYIYSNITAKTRPQQLPAK